MCVYCMISDHEWKWNPPKNVPPNPLFPVPFVLPRPWSLEQFKEFQDLLNRVKALEDMLGCPCDDPNKPDYLGIIKEAIEKLEQERGKPGS
jgi:hypothetical protein